jgi:L-asparaginase II
MSSLPRPALELHAAARRSEAQGAASDADPVLVRLWRGARVESQHRGAWVLVDPSGAVLDGAGDW